MFPLAAAAIQPIHSCKTPVETENNTENQDSVLLLCIQGCRGNESTNHYEGRKTWRSRRVSVDQLKAFIRTAEAATVMQSHDIKITKSYKMNTKTHKMTTKRHETPADMLLFVSKWN